MSTFDPSRTPYIHWRCGTLPCSCVRVHQPIMTVQIPCEDCFPPRMFFSMTEYQNHHLDAHEGPFAEAPEEEF